jgi:endogenous inhibitor of DNA gyrase (YacG/DUF329 family)
MKTAIVAVKSVEVTSPNCQQTLKVGGESPYFNYALSDEWDILEKRRKIACPYCHVYMIWPKNPFKREK